MSEDNPNSMQMQLGLVGGQGSFNPLGIATPAPPPPPMVRHPGEVSQDIVRQTQTAMATTLQTTSAMRLGGMGGMAFGGGGAVGAVGAFAQQYQQNMAGMVSQQQNPFGAQALGMMGGMGGGFSQGMLPHPAMMTTPGMGIYRPFPQSQGPTVSPFPQMPMFQTPFTPMPPPPQFQTPMELSNNMAIQAGQRRTAAMFAVPGMAARAGADIGFGAMGSGIGASIGARFGPAGAIVGAGIGGLAGMMGSEHFGLGATAQHMANNLNPFRTMALRGQQMMGASQSFVHGGADLNMQTGRGLSAHGATHLGRMLEETAYSSSFKRQTGGAFSAQDLTKITQISGQQGLLNDAQSVDQIHERVKGIAKSLVSFMKIANEPNVVEALKSMGRARQMGMSIGETMDMAVEARMYSKMAGTSSRGIMESGGLPGAMMFQQQGLSAGLGMRVGMGAMGMASAAVAGGAFSPQRLAMLGGTQGVAQHEMESSAAFLKMPMMAAAMSRMGSGGAFGVDGNAIKALRGGDINIGGMATMGANNLLDAVRKQGVGALGMAQVQGTEIQDQIGRLLGPQGLQAAKMGQVVQTMKMMGLDHNQGGFATAGLAMGMSNDQVKTMMSEAGSPGYWRNMQQQNRVSQMDLRGLASEERDRNQKGFFSAATRFSGGRATQEMGDLASGFRNVGEKVSNFFADDEQERQARKRGQVVLRTDRSLLAQDDLELRSVMNMSPEAVESSKQLREAGRVGTRPTDRNRRGLFGSDNDWDKLTGGDSDTRALRARRAGGVYAMFGGGHMEALDNAMAHGMSALGALAGYGKVRDFEEEGRVEDANARRGSDMWQEGLKYETTGEYDKAVAGIAGKPGRDKTKIARTAAAIGLRLASKAREDRKLIGRDQAMVGDTASKEIEAGIREEGGRVEDYTAAELKTMGALGKANARTIEGGDIAFGAEDAPDIKTHKELVDKLKGDMRNTTDMLFGKITPGTDSLGGTQTNRNELMQKMFGKGRTGKGAMLLALETAARAPGAGKGAKEAYLRELSKAGSATAREEMESVRKDIGEGHTAELTTIGARASELTERQFGAATEGTSEMFLGSKREVLDAAGRRVTFGEGASATADIGELLDGDMTKMSTEMQGLSKQYKVARAKGDNAEMARIKKEAGDESLSQGVAMESETAGGIETARDEDFKTRRETIAKAEKDTSKLFPQAVSTFNQASHAMLEAARILKSGGAGTYLRHDANLVE